MIFTIPFSIDAFTRNAPSARKELNEMFFQDEGMAGNTSMYPAYDCKSISWRPAANAKFPSSVKGLYVYLDRPDFV